MIKGLCIFGAGLSVGFLVGSAKSEKMAENLGTLGDNLGKLADILGNGPVEVTVNTTPTTPTDTEEKDTP